MYPIGEKCLKLGGKRNYKILFEIFFHHDFFFDLLGFFAAVRYSLNMPLMSMVGQIFWNSRLKSQPRLQLIVCKRLCQQSVNYKSDISGLLVN